MGEEELMEDPATWGKAERIVNDVHRAWQENREKPPSEMRYGLSFARQVTDALRAEGLLQQMVDADGHCDVCGTFLDGVGCPVCDGDTFPPPLPFGPIISSRSGNEDA